MHSPSSPGTALRALGLGLGLVFGLGTVGQAFTLIPFNTVEKASEGFPSGAGADSDSDSANKPRYTVSDDGCFVVFTSRARNLTPTQSDGNGQADVFLYESCGTYQVTLVSHVDGDPDKAANGASDQPVISPDARFVVFRSTADDIVPGTGYGTQTNVFLWDRLFDTFLLVSHKNSDDRASGDGDSQNGVINRGTGQRYVAFESLANNLNDSQAADTSQIYRYELGSGAAPVDLVSLANFGLPVIEADGHSYNPAISGSGLCVVYESEATNLVSDKPTDDLNGARDVFKWLGPRATILLSHQAGAPLVAGDGESTEASIADNCERFAFKSAAKNLTLLQVDGNGGTDVFQARNNGNDAVLVSHQYGLPDVAGSDPSDSPILSRDGNWVAFASLAKDLSDGQNDTATPSSDVFVHDVLGGKSALVSHMDGDPRTPGSGESFAPEISTNGLYVAYESDAKDLDPNQYDGNSARDVFLYNTRWNSSIVASIRYASIAITGNGKSFRPALSGDGYAVAFTGGSSNHIADDPDTPSAVDDVFLFKPSRFPPSLPFLSVRSTDRHVLQWVTPPVDYVSMRTFVSLGSTCASSTFPPAGGIEIFFVSPPANSIYQSPADGPYPSNTTVCYSIFVERDGTAILPGALPARSIVAHTLDAATPELKWASNLAGLTALSQVGIGTQNLVAVANDGGVYGLTRGVSGGLWPGGYRPFQTNFSPIQGRPPVVSFGVLGSTHTTFVGSQDGRAYAFDASRGAGPGAGGALWYTTPKLGDVVQPPASGMFTLFGGLANHILIGARSGSAGTFFALDAADGSPRGAFAGGGPTIGAIAGAASVDYLNNRVYFTSLEFTAGQPSLWCLNLTATGFGTSCWTPRTEPLSTSAGPVLRNGRLYVGDDVGLVWSFNAATGAPAWSGPYTLCGVGAVKGFVLADRGGSAQDLYYSNTVAVCAITDTGGSAPVPKWIESTIPGPSTPILARIAGVAYVFVGSSDGHLYQIEAETPANVTRVLLQAGVIIGPPAFDVFDSMVYAGSEDGAIYAVQAPF